MYQQILGMLLEKYGHLSYSELTEALRKDGLGMFVDAIENDAHLMGMIKEMSQNYTSDVFSNPDCGFIPEKVQQVHGTPVDYDGTFHFDLSACLTRCRGDCCKNRNYLMIDLPDIYRIVLSKGAQFLAIKSTIDLFDRRPPFAVIFYNEEYRWYLPYLRFLPVNTDIQTRPEEVKGSICPFLYPIDEVYSYHNKPLPDWVNNNALGCILMESKPMVCRLSPLGKNQGLMTGKVSYVYLPPVHRCPACDTNKEMKVSDYISSTSSYCEHRRQKQFHKKFMSYFKAGIPQEFDKKRFYNIVKQVYNIDGLLSHYGLGVEHRPDVDYVIEIIFAASRGDFSAYEEFIDGLQEN